MTNSEALKYTCNLLANTFYPDDRTIQLVLMNDGIEADADAFSMDAGIFRLAVRLVLGYVEGSRTENGISTSVKKDVRDSIRIWAPQYGLDADELLDDVQQSSIEDITHIW